MHIFARHRSTGFVTAATRDAEYQIVRNWIAAGAKLDVLDKSRVERLTIEPSQKTAKRGERFPMRVTAAFADR